MSHLNKAVSIPASSYSENEDLAYFQWLSLELIERKWAGRQVRQTINTFDEMVWRENRFGRKLHFNANDISRNLIFKCMGYKELRDARGAFSSTNSGISSLRTAFNELFGYDVLVGNRGERLKGLNEIDQTTFENNLDLFLFSHISAAATLKKVNTMMRICKSELSSSPLFCPSFELPWASIGVDKWVKARCQKLEISPPKVYPYLAMQAETYEPLIEKSMQLIESKADFIINCHKEFIEYSSQLSRKRMYFLALESYFSSKNKFEGFLKENEGILLGLPEYINTKSYQHWWVSVVNHLRAACLNVILFTTGIRNGDLTFLKIGCCNPTGKVDMLFYIDANIDKTKNRVHLPVPPQTKRAIEILEQLRLQPKCPYVFSTTRSSRESEFLEAVKSCPKHINRLLSSFAKFYKIPFNYYKEHQTEYTAHCYRATVAGWLEASGPLSIMMVRRLFGHTNNLMPISYLHHNPIFINHRISSLEQASHEMAKKMTLAATHNLLGGKRGEELCQGVEKLRKSSSLSEFDIFKTVNEQLQERISNGSMLAMATYFGVICTRNPNDSSQPPCRKRSDRIKLKDYEFDRELWNHMQSAPNPAQCIGKACEHAVIGPWSESLKESFLWFKGYLAKHNGAELESDAIALEARAFIKMYAPEMKKIFEVKSSD